MAHRPPKRLTLALLSGLLCDVEIWKEVINRLPGSIDVREFSFPNVSSIEQMAESVLASMPEHFAIAGHSMGGRVALETVRRAADRVLGVALLNTGVHPPAEHEAATRGRLVKLAQEQGMAALATEWLPPMLGRPESISPEISARLRAMVERSSPESFAAQIHALLHRPDAAAVLPHLPKPTLLLSATHDKWSPPAQHEAMQRVCADAELVIVEDAGHMAPVENPGAVTAALTRWLERVAAANQLETARSDTDFASVEAICKERIQQYARLNDAGAYDELVRMFTPDGLLSRPADPGNPLRGHDQILKSFTSRPPRLTLHVVFDVHVRVESHNRARATSRVVLFSVEQISPSGPVAAKLTGAFADILHKVGEEWLFAERRGVVTSKTPI